MVEKTYEEYCTTFPHERADSFKENGAASGPVTAVLRLPLSAELGTQGVYDPVGAHVEQDVAFFD